jgi:hypothetical protein
MKLPSKGSNGRLTRSERLILLTAGLGMLHHADHVLRYDHSGWPFRDIVTPFTYSLLVYPLIALVFLWRRGSWVRFVIALIILILTQSAHIFLETPRQQFCSWAYNASCTIGLTAGMPNLLAWHSPFMGAVAVMLSVALIAMCISLFLDACAAQKAKAK